MANAAVSRRCASGRSVTGLPERSRPSRVDLDGAHRELEILGRFRQQPAERALVLHLVVDREDFRLGALGREIALEVGGDLLERAHAFRLDLEHAQDHRAKAADHGAADLVLLERKGGLADRLVDDGALRQRAEIDVLLAQPALLGDLEKVRTVGDSFRCLLRLQRIVEADLLHRAALGREVADAPLLIGLLEVRVGDFDLLARSCGNSGKHHDLAVLGRAEHALAVLVVFREHLRRRLGDFAGLRLRQQDVFDGALFVLVAVGRLEQRLRHGRSFQHRARELPAQHLAALVGDIALLGGLRLAQQHLEPLPVELAVRSPQRGVGRDAPRHLGVGNAKPQRPDLLVERGLGDQLADQLPVDAERARLFHGDRTSKLAPHLLEPLGVELPELVGGDLGAADPCEARLAEAAEDVADAPDREADRDQPEQHAHDDLPSQLAEAVRIPRSMDLFRVISAGI